MSAKRKAPEVVLRRSVIDSLGGGGSPTDLPRPPYVRPRSLSESYALSPRSRAGAVQATARETSPDHIINPKNQPIRRIVLTGGPCAGKTTCMARLKHFLSSRGFRVYVAPEAATMLFSAGVSFSDIATEEGQIAMQYNLLRTQLHLEDSLANLARATGKPAVILCDRGTMDGRAYVSDRVWQAVLAKTEATNVALRDARYDAVLHMVTAAIGAVAHYGLENNATRSESVKEAAALDRKTAKCWVGHPRVETFDNSTHFEGKIQRVIRSVSHIVGFPLTKKQFKKFTLAKGAKLPDAILEHAEVFDIEKVYLTIDYPAKEKVKYTCIRRRKAVGSLGTNVAYGMTTSKVGTDGQDIELKRIITEREYFTLKRSLADATRFIVRQRRTCFLHEGIFFQLDEYRQPKKVVGVSILSFQLAEGQINQGSTKDIDFVEVDRDVTNIKEFSAFQISLRNPAAASKDDGTPAIADAVQ